MALPALTKTWQHDVNNAIPAQANLHDHCAAFMLNMVAALTGFSTNPWVVDYSCSGTTAGTPGDGVNRISALSDWVYANTAGARSWIVLRNPVTGMEILISGLGSFNGEEWTLAVSWAAGFTGGTTTTDPSATDQESIYPGDSRYGLGNFQRDMVYHWLHSDDGEMTYCVVNYANITSAFGYFGVPENPTDGWTNPLVAGWLGDDGTTPEFAAAALFNAIQDEWSFTGASGRRRANLTGGTIPIHTSFSGASMGDGSFTPRLWGETQGGSLYVPGPNQISGEYNLGRVGIVAFRQVGVRGYHGRLPDLFFSEDTMNDGDTFPGDGTKTRAKFGGYVVPWDGTVPITA